MERRVLAVCTVAAFLGLLSAALGFAAEATRIKGSQVEFVTPVQCAYPRSPAYHLGSFSVLALIISQIVLNVSNGTCGCCCCRKSSRFPDSRWRLAGFTYILSWFAFVIAFLLLLTGAALNDQHGEESMYLGNYYCYVVKPGVFAFGASLALVSVAFGIVYHLMLTAGKNASNSSYPNQGGIAMAQPQIPPPTSQDPVFVHEDTYMRRQLA